MRRGFAVLVGGALTLLMLRGAAGEAPAIDARSQIPDWTVQFADDFERAEVGNDWKALSGDWKIADGRLVGKGEILCAWRFPGAQRIEFEARAQDPGDLSGVLCAGEQGYKTGYFLGFGSEGNSCSKLLAAGKEVERADAKATAGRTHKIVCERLGKRITMTVDGQSVLAYEDETPLAGSAHERVGLYIWNEAAIDNVKILVRSDVAEPETVSKEDFNQRETTDNWEPREERDGWSGHREGDARLILSEKYGRGKSVGLGAFRSKDALNILYWHAHLDQGANTLGFHLMLPQLDSGVDIVADWGGYLSSVRIQPKEGIQVTATGKADPVTLVAPEALQAGRWYGVEVQHDFLVRKQRARVDKEKWSEWLPFQDDKGGYKSVEKIQFYCGVTKSGEVTFCIDDLATYELPGVTAARRVVTDPNLIANGSFENVIPGVRPRYPDAWLVEKWDKTDAMELVDDSARAHWGRRFVRLTSTRGDGVRLHNTPANRAVSYEPGKKHEMRVWARKSSGTPTLWVEPGRLETELTSDWKEYAFVWEHPKDAPKALGFFIAVRGGTADIDDASALSEGVQALPHRELKADRGTLKEAPAKSGWLEGYAERVGIEVSELVGEDAKGYRVSVPIQELFPALFHDFLSAEKIKVVDASVGAEVPATLLDTDGFEGMTPWDSLVFLADMEALTRKTYYVYLKDRLPAHGPATTGGLPTALRKDSEYAHELEVVVLDDESRAPAPKVLTQGWAVWVASGLELIRRQGPLTVRGDTARIAAAANEAEAFQVVIAAAEALADVDLAASDLTGEAGTIPADCVELMRVAEIDLPHGTVTAGGLTGGYNYYPYTGQAGFHPDPLLPWRPQDVPAGTQKVAWVSVRAPKGTRAGLYRGEIRAVAGNGDTKTLPVELEVFGFELPDVRKFTPVLGADVSMHLFQTSDKLFYSPYTNSPLGPEDQKDLVLRNRANQTRFEGGYEEGAMEVAELFASRGISPFYYGSDYCPYAISWRYDEGSATAALDFAKFDRTCEVLCDRYHVKHLFFGSRYYAGGDAVRRIYDGSFDPKTWENVASNDTEKALAMRRAWARAAREHLAARGWLDRACIYITDEPQPNIDEVVYKTARAWKEGAPELRNFAAGTGAGGWWKHFEATDIFAGATNAANRERMEARGIELWGPYNRPWHISLPLANTRFIGLDSWRLGYKGYFHWGSTKFDNVWLNSTLYYRAKTGSAGYPDGLFVMGMYPAGMADLVYPWPADEPSGDRRRYVVRTMRFEALCKGIADYEYARLFEEKARRLPAGDAKRKEAEEILSRLRTFVEKANRGGSYTHKVKEHGVFIVDDDAFEALRREIGRMLARLS
ncbi:MAG: glycoside hydrolase domain-containing protein [Planctomycetota bacterium]